MMMGRASTFARTSTWTSSRLLLFCLARFTSASHSCSHWWSSSSKPSDLLRVAISTCQRCLNTIPLIPSIVWCSAQRSTFARAKSRICGSVCLPRAFWPSYASRTSSFQEATQRSTSKIEDRAERGRIQPLPEPRRVTGRVARAGGLCKITRDASGLRIYAGFGKH